MIQARVRLLGFTCTDDSFETAALATKLPNSQMTIQLTNGESIQFRVTSTGSGLLPVSSAMISAMTLGALYLVLRLLLQIPAPPSHTDRTNI